MTMRTVLTAAVAVLLAAGAAQADLLGIDTLYPQITYDSGGTLSYDASTKLFQADATPLLFRLSSTAMPTLIQTPRDFDLNILINNDGSLLGGVAGHDLIVQGDVDADGDSVIDYSGVLLTGEIIAYGALDSGTTDQYDFRFQATGGALVTAGFFDDMDIGVVMNSLNSTFAGDFTVDFGGTSEGRLGPVPEPATMMLMLPALGVVMARRRR